jgi:phage terminase large subunit
VSSKGRVITLPHNFDPRPYQLDLLRAFDEGKKRLLCVWHRRAGKDKTCINVVARETQKRVGTYFYFLPTFSQGKRIIWDGMDGSGFRFLHHFPQELWDGQPNSTEMKLKLKNGSVFQVVGSDSIDGIVGTNPVGCVFSEFALQDPRGWDYVRPILAENGGWALFNGTPRGRNHYYRLHNMAIGNDNWWTQLLGYKDTGVLTEEQVQEEIQQGMPPELAAQEFECSWQAAQTGSYYGALIEKAYEEKRITDVPYDPELPVDTWWDLGVGDATAIVFVQEYGMQVRVIDYLEDSGEGLPFYIKQLAEKPYIYRDHVAPHDIEVRELGTGKSRLETARGLGLKFRVARKLSLDDGINATRMLIPKMWFDRTNCARLIESLEAYRKEYDFKREIFKDRPYHDWSSHACDALRTGAVGKRNAKVPQKRDRYARRLAGGAPTSWMAA